MSDLATPAAKTPLRTVLAVVISLSLLGAVVAVRAITGGDGEAAPRSTAAEGGGTDLEAGDGAGVAVGTNEALGATGPDTAPGAVLEGAGRTRGATSSGRASAKASSTEGESAGGASSQTGGDGEPASGGSSAALPGVTDDEITVVYYWKGDRTRTSPYLAGTGMEGNVDEAEAFRKLVDFINANDGKASLMGQRINLHGRKLKGIVVEAGQDPEDHAAAGEKIVKELKPFAAVAAHGSVSAYLCPTLAEAGIHNFATYDLTGDLAAKTNGYCLPSGMTWDKQVEVTEGYLAREQRAEKDRAYGVVYAEYPGLVESAPKMVEQLRRAGVNVAAVASVSASLTTAQQQASNVVGRMRGAGVDTIVMPDAGAPINFTHAAQAQGYNPDYYVWPCSGQDTMGMVRLLNGAQWSRAEGLTCYDPSFTSDLTVNEPMRKTEWYRAYQSAAPGKEPPAPTPFVYAAMLPLVTAIDGAGRELTLERVRGALDGFAPYRYDAVAGRSENPKNMLLGFGRPDRGVITDAIRLRYNPARTEPGSIAPGTDDFPEARRYASRADFGG